MGYLKFWDKFNNELYKEIVADRNDHITIRINNEDKEKFKNRCLSMGGMSNVMNAFIKTLNERESKNI